MGPLAAGGQPYPGASTEEEIATCPRLSARLEAWLDVEFSYWTGTLPSGSDSRGCNYATVPLRYDPDPYDYAHVYGLTTLVDAVEAVYG